MNTSREPPGPRYQGPCPPSFSYQEQFGVPSCSPPEYQQNGGYFNAAQELEQRFNTPLKRMDRVKKLRAGRPRDEVHWHNKPPDDHPRGEWDRSPEFPTQPPSDGPKIRETPRHRVEAVAVGRPFSWINTEATTPEVVSLPEPEDEVVDAPRMDPMAESPPEEDGMPSRWVQVTDAQYLLLKDFQEFQERQRKSFYQHPISHPEQRDQVVRAVLYIPHPASAEARSLANPEDRSAEIAARRAGTVYGA
ncbi:unnamed protein product [Clonostachys rosea f. rosea IK726]|uniref:Uncharacterized protein n=1 Tax=Clonostachys rosea f. rosea IK726 TaxID=1349383 RepID=A0ACA9T6S1_BIOOC|nr:unnamed protein product [Clonostachys rosea f. rosea IK726]